MYVGTWSVEGEEKKRRKTIKRKRRKRRKKKRSEEIVHGALKDRNIYITSSKKNIYTRKSKEI